MKKRWAAAAAVAVILSVGFVVRTQAKTLNLRPETTVKLMIDAERDFEVKLPEGPYVVNNEVNILPGEKIRVAASAGDGGKLTLAFAEESRPESDIELEFAQAGERASHQMRLKIHNPFPKALTAKTLVHYAGEKKIEEGLPIAALPSQTSSVVFQKPIVRIILKDIELSDKVFKEAGVPRNAAVQTWASGGSAGEFDLSQKAKGDVTTLILKQKKEFCEGYKLNAPKLNQGVYEITLNTKSGEVQEFKYSESVIER